MAKIEFDKDEKEAIIKKLQTYFEQELQHEIGQFDSEFLLDFISKELGGYYYNRGLLDAQAFLEKKIETITDGFYELEQPTN